MGGSDIYAKDDNGATALDTAVNYKSQECAAYLLEMGAVCNIENFPDDWIDRTTFQLREQASVS